MVLKVTRGYSPQYLLKEVATGRENYYTGAVAAGEPPGRWWGSGAELLGLRGLVDAQDMTGVYERFLDPREEGFTDPARWDEVYTLGQTGRRYLSEEELYAAALEREPDADAERRMELKVEAGKAARHNVAFFDLTFNVPKSVTLLHTAFEAQEVAAQRAGDMERAAAWGQFRQAVEDAIWAGNDAMLAYLNAEAGYSRIGHHGGAAGRWIDARDWVVASFFQHDSREHDPHLHVHNATLNRVLGADGVWRTLDGQLLYRHRPAAAAVGERTLGERLSHTLGVLVATRPDGKAREVVGVAQQAMDLISTRRRQVTSKTAELVEAFEARHGRAPNSLQLDRLAQQATLLTRRSKTHTGESRAELLDRVDATIRADVDGGLAQVAHTVLDARGGGPVAQEWSPQAVIELALEEVRRAKSGWTAADLTAAIDRALPDYLGTPDGADVTHLLRTLTAEALTYATALDRPQPGDELLPDELRLANGQSSYMSPGAARYATPDQIHTERVLVAATTARGATALPAAVAARFVEQLRQSGIELGADQAAAVRGVLTSGARVECLIGPAGTGKSFVVGALAHAWTDPAHSPTRPADIDVVGGGSGGAAGCEPPRRVFGLATSQIATDVLTAEGLTARNVTQWLGTQDRLAAGPGSGRPQPVDGDEAWRLHSGDLVVVDESAMTDTHALARIQGHVDAAGAKLLLVGDHRQLAAVGAGGAMDLLAQAGTRYELTEARRFTHDWERAASLRLREGDETVLRTYHQQGRLLDSGTREQAEASAARAFLADTLAGRQSVLLVDDNTAAARLSGQLRAELVRLGRVAEHGVPLAQGTVAGVGDLVQARWNGWHLAGVEGNRRGPVNRETYRVTTVRDDGSLDVRTTAGQRLVLPSVYVAEHLALAYASTVHAAQGRTTDTSHAVITSWTSLAALYVALSRGREANTAHVATTSTLDDPAQGRDADHAVHRDPVALLAGILADTQAESALSATAIAEAAAARVGNVQTLTELLADAAQLAATDRTVRWLDQLTDAGHLDPAQRAQLAAEDGAASLARTLRRVELAGLDPRQVLLDAVAERSLAGAHNLTNVLHDRITDGGTRSLDPVGSTWSEWVPRTGNAAWDAYLAALAAQADDRTVRLGREAVEHPPGWALEALGPVPADLDARQAWQERVGTVAAYRELCGVSDPADTLGRPPAVGQVEAYAAYRAAWNALGRPEVEQAEHERTTGAHLARIRAWQREQTWAPRYVGNELAGTRQAAAHHRQTATLRTVEADATLDPAARARLQQQADDAAALAATLDEQITVLEDADEVWARWRAHTAGTRTEAEISRRVLAGRGDEQEPEQVVTAEEWLDAHRDAVAADEHDRPITDDDVHDDTAAQLADRKAPIVVEDVVEPDLREVAAHEPRQTGEDRVQVSDADRLAATVARARRTIHEIDARDAYDQHAEHDQRTDQLGRWRHDDHSDGDALDGEADDWGESDADEYAPVP